MLRRSMPRPKADFPAPDAIRALIRDGLLRVRVSPGARSESVAVEPDRLSVKVRARPTVGRARRPCGVLESDSTSPLAMERTLA